MSSGLTQVIGLLLLTVIVLPCAFFTLLAFLDRFERSLSATPTTSGLSAAPTSSGLSAAPTSSEQSAEPVALKSVAQVDLDAQIVPLPIHLRSADPAAVAI